MTTWNYQSKNATSWTNANKNATTWTPQERSGVIPAGTPIGLLLALTFGTPVFLTDWTYQTKN